MNKHTLQVLEFDSILSLLKGFVTSDLGRSLCESLRPKRDIQEIHKLLDEVTELKEVLQIYGDIPIGGIRNVEECVGKTRVEGAVLDPFEFIDILSTLNAAHALKGFFKRLEDIRYPLIREMGNRLILLPDLQGKIERTVGHRGDILDSASPRLQEIRSKIKRLRAKIQRSLDNLFVRNSSHPFFQERIITIRNGRYVVPVKSDFKGRIQGIIHDHSHSKATYFIEPIFTIELNNELGLLFKEEKAEELKVLKNLSKDIHANCQEIIATLEVLGKIDLTYAKARYSVALNARKPILNKEGRVNMINAYHPLLLFLQGGSKDVVPINIHLNKGCNTLIITGANTGGKTVALKTAGVLTLMVNAGMHICVADHSEVAIFDAIFADIGDEQGIEQDLSTFSSHISQIVEILGRADDSSLVLLDEIGGGTDPEEGAGLAMALLDHFREKGSRTITTTHLNLLKAYAYLHEDVTNVSVEFDPETMEPRYSLIYGVPGESNALVIARALGVPGEILDDALGYMTDNNGNIGSLIRALESSQTEILEEKKEIKQLKDTALACQEQIESLLESIQEKRERILLETEKRAGTLLRKTEDEVREIVKDLKKKGKDRVHVIDERLHHLRGEISLLTPVINRKEDRGHSLNLKRGDVVRITPLCKEGVIVHAKEGSGQVEVLIGNLKVKVRPDDLERVKGKPPKEPGIERGMPFAAATTGSTDKINVIGMRVFDALPLVDKAIDSAILSGIEKLAIIHGIGTGRLREAICSHLKANSLVENIDSADLSHGGAGVTVVEIRS